MQKNTVIREMKIEDYDRVLSLWQSDRSIYLDERDSLENIQKYLESSNLVEKLRHYGT
ncbi:MAG: hypothetical protein O4859_27245 [Trichodesmium sp. St18_bin1]|nr:hypothetical protein [Trichodesmium sp. St18_bin1]MDE5120863.1 hypothetical protein [Trichodesmium sp. St19_bin1]